MNTADLLTRCASVMTGGGLSAKESTLLRKWAKVIEQRTAAATARFLSAPICDWEQLITGHTAHVHQWYDFIDDEITIDEMAVFLLENSHYPIFLRLLEAIRSTQICKEGRAAVDENIADERQPESHAELMRRMMDAVSCRAQQPLNLDLYPSLIDRTLVFYYGYFRNPWHLVGSVFATERMGTRRVKAMYKGLRRLGLDDYELEFAIIHAQCDDHHAGDWLKRVIEPSVALRSDLRVPIAIGIASCLETSTVYLDYLTRRAEIGRAIGLPQSESC